MKRKTIMAIIAISIIVSFVGCTINETIILENSKSDRINKPLIEFKTANYNPYQDNNYMKYFAYYRGNIYTAKYNTNYNPKSYPSPFLEESLYIINSDGSKKESELKIPSAYSVNYNENNNPDILFSQTGMYDWRTGLEKELITDEMTKKFTINTTGTILVKKELGYLNGTTSHVLLTWKNDFEEQFLILNLETNSYKISEVLPYNNNEDKKSTEIYNTFYYEKEDKIYSIRTDGTIYDYTVSEGILKHNIYDKIELNDGESISKIMYHDCNVYIAIYHKSDKNRFPTKYKVVRYHCENKTLSEVYTNTSGEQMLLTNSNDGYVMIRTKKSLNSGNETNTTIPIDLYKYNLFKLDGDEYKFIRQIAEDETSQTLDPSIYVNESEGVVLVVSIMNNGIQVKYQVFGLENK